VLYIDENCKPLENLGIDKEEFNNIIIGELKNSMINEDNKNFFCYYQPVDSLKVVVVIVPVDADVYSTIDEVEKQLSSYGLIYLFKESIIKGKLIWGIGVIFILILAVLSVYVAGKLSKSITEPIGELSSSFSRVADGDLDVYLDVNAKDEVNILISSFNKMVKDLKETQKKLLQSERIAAWREVARQISHEIKNPLTPIRLSIHRLKKKIHYEKEDESTINECFQTISEEVESLKKIASEFSEFARLPEPKFEKANINEVIKSAVALYKTNKKNARFQLELDNNLPEFYFDFDLMKRVIINLITNSIDALKKNNDIIYIKSERLTKGEGEENVAIYVVDYGIGMDKNVIEKIFDPYFTTKKDGTGLGMAVIKRIIDEHSGKITVESEPEKGTKITIILKPHLIKQKLQTHSINKGE
ncbi:hypothetical protein DRQ09_07200, partial [candidate division KSB1 bacterium]